MVYRQQQNSRNSMCEKRRRDDRGTAGARRRTVQGSILRGGERRWCLEQSDGRARRRHCIATGRARHAQTVSPQAGSVSCGGALAQTSTRPSRGDALKRLPCVLRWSRRSRGRELARALRVPRSPGAGEGARARRRGRRRSRGLACRMAGRARGRVSTGETGGARGTEPVFSWRGAVRG